MGAGVSLKWAIFAVTLALLADNELRRIPIPRTPVNKALPRPDRARTAGEGMLISSGIMYWCTRTQGGTQAERLGEGLGHRGGVEPTPRGSVWLVAPWQSCGVRVPRPRGRRGLTQVELAKLSDVGRAT